MFDPSDTSRLKRELVTLFGHLQKIKKELAALQPAGDGDHFSSMSDQLDAIVEATETATNTIMENVEGIEAVVEEVRGRAPDDETGALLDSVTDRVNAVFEACSFQDITGQRITKVVNSLKYVEERVNAVVLTWGREDLAQVVVEIKEELSDPDKKLLNGPQLAGKGVSQDDVDKLFDQNDIDALFA